MSGTGVLKWWVLLFRRSFSDPAKEKSKPTLPCIIGCDMLHRFKNATDYSLLGSANRRFLRKTMDGVGFSMEPTLSWNCSEIEVVSAAIGGCNEGFCFEDLHAACCAASRTKRRLRSERDSGVSVCLHRIHPARTI